MLKNFLKVAFRNLVRNKVYVGINIIGLGLALACCIVAYLNSKFNWDFDKHHVNIDHIYKLHNQRELQGNLIEYGRVPMPMADAIRNDFAGVDRVFRYEIHTFTVRDVNMDKVFNSRICYADPGFLESFTFPLITGDPKAYHKLDHAIVTKRYAEKFYGDEDPIGKVITIFDDSGMNFNFVISGVVEEAPQNSSVNFEILLNFKNRFRMYDDEVKGNWGHFAQATFLYFEDPKQAEGFAEQFDKYIPILADERPDFVINKFLLSPMNKHAHISRQVRWDILRDAAPPAAVLTPQIMAILILLVACFNFTNTSIANANRRLKEIGIRKVLGGSRRQLIYQFMTENLTICLLALLVGIGIATYLVPAYSAMWEFMDLELTFSRDIWLYIFLFALLVFTTLLAGLYPSLYISKYRPVRILRGSLSIGGVGRLSKALLAAQYTFTVMAIFASVAFIQNARYQETLDLGFSRDQVIGISLLNETQYQQIRASMLANPDITQIASAKNHIGRGNYSQAMKSEDRELEVNMLDVGIGYLETMSMDIVQGRSFTKELEASDSKNSIIVNEKLVEEFGWDNPIGQRVTVNDTTTLNVVGVVNDFYMYGFWAPLEPVGIRLSTLKFVDDGNYNFIVARTDISNTSEVYDYLEKEWNGKIPNKTYPGFYQEDLLKEAKEVNNNIMVMFSFLGVVAFILSALGLFTLVSINLINRTKEIGVRKVLGGSTGHIVFLISRSYLWLLLISSVLGLIFGYFLIDSLISSIFNNYKNMDVITFVLPAILVIGISLTIAGLRTMKFASLNPVKTLRYE